MRIPVNVTSDFEHRQRDPLFEEAVIITRNAVDLGHAISFAKSRHPTFEGQEPLVMATFVNPGGLFRRPKYVAIIHTATANMLNCKRYFDHIPEIEFTPLQSFSATRLWAEYVEESVDVGQTCDDDRVEKLKEREEEKDTK